MFLYDCLKKGLKLYYVPVSIGRMIGRRVSMVSWVR